MVGNYFTKPRSGDRLRFYKYANWLAAKLARSNRCSGGLANAAAVLAPGVIPVGFDMLASGFCWYNTPYLAVPTGTSCRYEARSSEVRGKVFSGVAEPRYTAGVTSSLVFEVICTMRPAVSRMISRCDGIMAVTVIC